MRKLTMLAAALLAAAMAATPALGVEHGEDTNIQLPKGLAGISIGFLGYVDYSYGEFSNIAEVKPSPSFAAIAEGSWRNENRFELTRGYINISKEILPWLSARVTPDVTRVSEGDKEAGDLDLRFKYYYLQIEAPDAGPFTNNTIKVGQQQFPYLDFLEHVNPYRMQGTMFQERFHNFNSADMGVGIQGYFGGKVSEEYQKAVNHYYPGRWGSYQVAVVNGGGYHASENNNNKPVEYRLTLRPLPDSVPGLQVTYFGIWGKGNTATAPDWRVNTALLSYQHQLGTLTFEYARNKGEQSGADENWRTGYAVFGMVRPPMLPRWRASAQYGVWDPQSGGKDNELTMWRAGIDYSLTEPRDIGGTFIYAGYERLSYGEAWNSVAGVSVPEEWRAQVVTQINW
jgi:hypothetical protein